LGIGALQEQITNERKMRERMANTESAFPVVTVGGPSAVTIKPRSAEQTPVPAFVVENASSGAPQQKQAAPTVVDPKLLDKTTLVLPPMAPSSRPLVSQQVLPQSTTGDESIGSDAIADQWRECLADKPSAWRSLLSRQEGTSIFNFGSQRVACKCGPLPEAIFLVVPKDCEVFALTTIEPKQTQAPELWTVTRHESGVTLNNAEPPLKFSTDTFLAFETLIEQEPIRHKASLIYSDGIEGSGATQIDRMHLLSHSVKSDWQAQRRLTMVWWLESHSQWKAMVSSRIRISCSSVLMMVMDKVGIDTDASIKF